MHQLKVLAKDILQLIYPKICIHCGTTLNGSESTLCIACMNQLPLYNGPDLSDKFRFLKIKTHAWAFLNYSRKGMARELIHEIKYVGNRELAKRMGCCMGKELNKTMSFLSTYDLLIPAPLHPRRQRDRGFNQSEWVAKGLEQVLGIEVRTDLVKRRLNTSSQTGRNRAARLKNTKGAFDIYAEGLEGKSILLLDDVITTGATIGEIALLLEESNCEAIGILAVAAGK